MQLTPTLAPAHTALWTRCTVLHGRYELLEKMEPLMVGGSTTGEIHFGRHSDAKPPLRCVNASVCCFATGGGRQHHGLGGIGRCCCNTAAAT